MQTTIGIIICLIVIVIFSIGYMNNYEGLTTATTTTATTATTSANATITSPTGAVPLSTVVENAEKAATTKDNTIALSTNKNDYAELINHLLDYYDNKIIYEIANAKQDKDGEYDLSIIVRYKNIKEALIQSLEYVS
jgi:hypothetical protein